MSITHCLAVNIDCTACFVAGKKTDPWPNEKLYVIP